MNPYDKMLNTIVEFKEYLDDIIKKGYKNDIVKLSSIYHMIKEYKEDQETNDQMITFEYNDDIDMKEIDDMIDMLQNDEDTGECCNSNTVSGDSKTVSDSQETQIILYKKNQHYQDRFAKFMETMNYY